MSWAHRECARCIRRVVGAEAVGACTPTHSGKDTRYGDPGLREVSIAETSGQLIERSVWWAIARLATSRGLYSRRGVTLMLKVNLLASVAYFLAGLFGRSEGTTWA